MSTGHLSAHADKSFLLISNTSFALFRLLLQKMSEPDSFKSQLDGL